MACTAAKCDDVVLERQQGDGVLRGGDGRLRGCDRGGGGEARVVDALDGDLDELRVLDRLAGVGLADAAPLREVGLRRDRGPAEEELGEPRVKGGGILRRLVAGCVGEPPEVLAGAVRGLLDHLRHQARKGKRGLERGAERGRQLGRVGPRPDRLRPEPPVDLAGAKGGQALRLHPRFEALPRPGGRQVEEVSGGRRVQGGHGPKIHLWPERVTDGP